jgi:hypothetical protein
LTPRSLSCLTLTELAITLDSSEGNVITTPLAPPPPDESVVNLAAVNFAGGDEAALLFRFSQRVTETSASQTGSVTVSTTPAPAPFRRERGLAGSASVSADFSAYFGVGAPPAGPYLGIISFFFDAQYPQDAGSNAAATTVISFGDASNTPLRSLFAADFINQVRGARHHLSEALHHPHRRHQHVNITSAALAPSACHPILTSAASPMP